MFGPAGLAGPPHVPHASHVTHDLPACALARTMGRVASASGREEMRRFGEFSKNSPPPKLPTSQMPPAGGAGLFFNTKSTKGAKNTKSSLALRVLCVLCDLCVEKARSQKLKARSSKPSSDHNRSSFQTRTTSETLQAWARQPRWMCGVAPSSISGNWPREPVPISSATEARSAPAGLFAALP